MLKKINLVIFGCAIAFGLNINAYAEEDYSDEVIEEIEIKPVVDETDMEFESTNDADEFDMEYADAVAAQTLQDYDMSGSLFEKITLLEQDKVVMQLEKERAQLDLELDRLNAERIKLQMELDTLSGRAEQQQQELETAKKQLEIQTEKLKRQREDLDDYETEPVVSKQQVKYDNSEVSKRYKLINVVGVDNQLQATVEEISTGQNKRIAVGKELDGYVVKSISLNDGIVFEKDGETESLNIGK